MGKRPRHEYVYIGHREPYQGVTFKNGVPYVHLLSGAEVEADAVFSQRTYDRSDGRNKVLVSIPGQAVFHMSQFLPSGFDAIWAIDTNTKQIRGEMVSVSCILECYAPKNEVGSTQEIRALYRKHGNMPFVPIWSETLGPG